jgi:hypothetical protein
MPPWSTCALSSRWTKRFVALAAEHRCLVTLEENVVAGGAGSAVNECLAARGINDSSAQHRACRISFIEQGERAELLAECGLDAAAVLRQLATWGLIQSTAVLNIRVILSGISGPISDPNRGFERVAPAWNGVKKPILSKGAPPLRAAERIA